MSGSTVTELSGALADGVALWRHIVGIALLLALLALAAAVTAVVMPGPRRPRPHDEQDADTPDEPTGGRHHTDNAGGTW